MLIEIYFTYIYVILLCLVPVTNISNGNIFNFFLDACIKVHKVDQKVLLELIASTVKSAPQQKGGDKNKVQPNIFKIFLRNVRSKKCVKGVWSMTIHNDINKNSISA